MFDQGAWPLVQMGLAAGLLHSLDADHVAAVAGLSSQQSRAQRWPYFSLQWAAGHGAAIIIIAVAVCLLGMAIPYRMSAIAESAVAYTLIIIGVLALVQLFAEYRQGHQSLMTSHKKATAVGLLHGCAGSAPLLALLPAATAQSPLWGMAYVLIFCTGVLIAMLVLGKLLAVAINKLQSNWHHWVVALRGVFACLSLLLGCYLAI